MNFLELCRRTREKCGISGSGPAAVTGQQGEMLRIINWVNEAWVEIQNAQPDWMWMRGTFSVPTVNGQQTYTTAAAGIDTTFSHWHLDTFRVYQTARGVSDEQFLHPQEYLQFRDVYAYSNRIPGRPAFFAVQPWDQSLMLGPIPNDGYTVVGEYQKKASEMTVNSDIPALPSQYHMLIVYGAMERYAAYESAPEVMVPVSREYDEMRSKLMGNQLSPVFIEQTLA